MQEILEKLKEWVVNDYFTPNIKAEVILDTLLTEYIAEIISGQMKEGIIKGKLSFLTKEMSIQDKDKDGQGDNRGAKIDYVLEDDEFVYLIELKTSKGSIDTEQVNRYTENFSEKNFGEALGNKLLGIMEDKYLSKKDQSSEKDQLSDSNLRTSENPQSHPSEKLKILFEKIVDDYKGETFADRARKYLKENNRGSTYKYLYTVGQLLHNHSGEMEKLWEKHLKLIYLTPDGNRVIPNGPRKKDKQEQEKAQQEWEKLYVRPEDKESFSLKKSASRLRENHSEDEYAQLLADIIDDIYPD